MDAFTGYIYTAMWLILAIYMFYLAIKDNKFFFVLSAFFLFLTGWYLCNEIIPGVDLFTGVYSWIYRGVALVVLVLCVIAYLKHKKSKAQRDEE